MKSASGCGDVIFQVGSPLTPASKPGDDLTGASRFVDRAARPEGRRLRLSKSAELGWRVAKNKRKEKQAAARKANAEQETRRAFLSGLKWKIGGATAFGLGGFLLFDHFAATAAEHDLGRIGLGVPTVVQIHDPQCTQCIALQNEVRSALSGVEEDELLYLVANIRTTSGRALANRYGAPHVTLLLFDGAGNMTEILSGPNEADRLRDAFAAHIGRG